MIFSTAYLPPISYVLELLKSKDTPIIEQFEHYSKQSYRNRTYLLGANGTFSLSIPVLKKSHSKTLVKDLEIKYDENWQANHWKSITSAYLSSPYFMYYQDDLLKFYSKNYKFLLDFNLELMDYVISKMKIELEYKLSNQYHEKIISDPTDLRDIIHPKKNYPHKVDIKPYTQVFSNKFDFQANLSIFDLLCNEGQNSELILNKYLNNLITKDSKYIFPILKG